MLYYPSKYEIYSKMLKNHILEKMYTSHKNNDFNKKLTKIKVYELVFSSLFFEPTDAKRFIENLFYRIEAVSKTKGKNIRLSLKGQGIFLLDRRLITYILLELASETDSINVNVKNNGLIISGCFNSSKQLCMLLKKSKAFVQKQNNTIHLIGISMKQTSFAKSDFCTVIESLENEYSPEYLWL